MLCLVTFFIAMVIICDCKPVAPEYNAERANWYRRHPECLEGDNIESAQLRKDCEIIFNNEYVKWSEEMLEDEEFSESLEVIDVTNHSGRSHTRHKRSAASSCPLYDQAYLASVRKPQQRSLSPWKFVKTVDQNRIPRALVDSQCLCKGCIDTSTGREDAENFVSHPLTMDVPAISRSKLGVTTVSIGCTCMFPLTTSSK